MKFIFIILVINIVIILNSKMASADLTTTSESEICSSSSIDFNNIYGSDKTLHEIIHNIEKLETSENMDDCPLCMEPYNITTKKPVILACFHKCCSECFSQLPTNHINKQKMYRCYEESCQDNKNYNYNILINETIMDKLYNDIPEPEIKCNICNKNQAIFHCKNCLENTNLCKNCFEFIHIAKEDHIQISIKEYNKESKSILMCSNHKSSKIIYCCIANKYDIKFLCNKCILEKYINTRNLIEFNNYYDKQKITLLNLITNIFPIITQIHELIEKWKVTLNTIEECQKNEIKKIYDYLKTLNTNVQDSIIYEECRRSHILRSKIIITLFKSIINDKLQIVKKYIIELYRFMEIITSILKLFINPSLYYNKKFLIDFTNYITFNFKYSISQNFERYNNYFNIFDKLIVINLKKAFDISNRELAIIKENGLYTIFTVVLSSVNRRSVKL